MSSKYLSRRSLEPRSKSEGKLIIEFLRRSRENAPRDLEGMPPRHLRDAPWFSGCASDLFRYFEEVRSLCERENCFDDQEWAKWICWYASSEISDSWYEFVEDHLSWPEFVVAIARLYPGSRKMGKQYSRNDLYSLVDSRARREIHTEEELMNYRLYFLDLAMFLRVSKQLEADELEDLYVQGFDKEFRREIIRKMRCDDRQQHSDDPWPMEQEAVELERVKPALVEEPLMTKVPFEFEVNYNTQRGFSFCSYRVSLMATGVSLQESYLRGRGSERSDLGVPAVSRNTHQLTDDLFRSKIPLEFKAERLEEHPKPAGVGVEGLEALTGSLEVERLAYKEVIDSHRAPQHMNHIKSKVIARRIQIEEPLRLIIQRKPPDEVLRIEMLRHVARVDDLALEVFHSSTVPAIYILFEDSSSESMRAFGIRTCTESPAMLTKRSHVTALRVVTVRTQVLHTDDSTVTGRLCKIAAVEEYEEWGEWRTVWKLLQLRAAATAARTTTAATRATTTTMTTLSTDRRPRKDRTAVRWEWGTTSADTELDGSEVRFDFETPYLHLCYSREGNYLRRTATIAIQTTTTTLISAGQRLGKIEYAVRWEQSATSAGTGLDGPRFCFDSIMLYLQLSYSREGGYMRWRPTDVRVIVIQETTTTVLNAERWPCEARTAVICRRSARSADIEHYGSRFYFDFIAFYLQLSYSRKSERNLRRSTVAARESMQDHERKTLGRTAKQGRQLRFDLQQRPSRIQERV
ncbi:hypothetical protein M404DRAFT_22198 [Pisolithus tinctorius Marx 270]|uniref:Uncharacterized protein n=1 Tax=Pisolithus tinctorius Marx 270 TaxID=870435 RepID=A0A0C3PK12_PISTI|nr:hypothetical protein M404DRAFT_22198 [Pisolithus tinctorius Marx 270]